MTFPEAFVVVTVVLWNVLIMWMISDTAEGATRKVIIGWNAWVLVAIAILLSYHK